MKDEQESRADERAVGVAPDAGSDYISMGNGAGLQLDQACVSITDTKNYSAGIPRKQLNIKD